MTLPDRFRHHEGADWPKDPPHDRAWLCALWFLAGAFVGLMAMAIFITI